MAEDCWGEECPSWCRRLVCHCNAIRFPIGLRVRGGEGVRAGTQLPRLHHHAPRREEGLGRCFACLHAHTHTCTRASIHELQMQQQLVAPGGLAKASHTTQSPQRRAGAQPNVILMLHKRRYNKKLMKMATVVKELAWQVTGAERSSA